MKKFAIMLLVIFLIISSACICVSANTVDDCNQKITYQIQPLRAGGGGSGGGGSGGGSGSSGGGSSHHTHGGMRRGSILSNILSSIMFIFVVAGTTIIFKFKLFKYSKKSKKLIAMLGDKDHVWKFDNILKQVEATYFAIQNAWTKCDMAPAQKYMTEELYDQFNTKINWMVYRNKKNVLEKIRLLSCDPVSVYDDTDNLRDYVWFYIKGSMVDYIIDTTTNLKIEGNTAPEKFEEYWQFTRNKDGKWVLNKILQKNESEQIVFTE